VGFLISAIGKSNEWEIFVHSEHFPYDYSPQNWGFEPWATPMPSSAALQSPITNVSTLWLLLQNKYSSLLTDGSKTMHPSNEG